MNLWAGDAQSRSQVGLAKTFGRLEVLEARDDAAPHRRLGPSDGQGLFFDIEVSQLPSQWKAPSSNTGSRAGARSVTPSRQNLALSTRRTSRPGITTASLLSAVALRIVSSARLWPTSVSAIPGLAAKGFQRT